MEIWRKCFGFGTLKLIGMIHVPALPGTPRNVEKLSGIVRHVQKEASIYALAGVDAVLVENMHDVPYLQPDFMGPEITASMTRVCHEVRSIVPQAMPCGVQILAAANREAVAVAAAAGLQFVRCEGFVFGHIADEGWTNSCAAQLMRYRKTINAEDILILADIKKKHSSHAITGDVDIGETAAAAEFFLADGLVVTGSGTGHAADKAELAQVRARSSLPVLIGSGVTADNVRDYVLADGLIVGSYFKKNARWNEELQQEKVVKLVSEIKKMKLSSTGTQSL